MEDFDFNLKSGFRFFKDNPFCQSLTYTWKSSIGTSDPNILMIFISQILKERFILMEYSIINPTCPISQYICPSTFIYTCLLWNVCIPNIEAHTRTILYFSSEHLTKVKRSYCFWLMHFKKNPKTRCSEDHFSLKHRNGIHMKLKYFMQP